MVQLRDLETHQSLPGRKLGNIGPKIGINSVDNDYCQFIHARIPRYCMGMRFSQVTRSGEYKILSDNEKAGAENGASVQEPLYYTMLQTRLVFIRITGFRIAQGCTIAVRNLSVQRKYESADQPSPTASRCLLDDLMPQLHISPLVAAAYSTMFTGENHYIST